MATVAAFTAANAGHESTCIHGGMSGPQPAAWMNSILVDTRHRRAIAIYLDRNP